MKVKLKKLMTKVLSSIQNNEHFTTEWKSASFGAAKNNVDYSAALNVQKTGWTPIGVIGFKWAGSWWTWFHVNKWEISGSTLSVAIRSNSTTSFTSDGLTLFCLVLYRKVGGYCVTQLFQGLQRFSHRSCMGVM